MSAMSPPEEISGVTCEEVMNMVVVNVPESVLLGVVRGLAGPFDRETYDCLKDRAAPEFVLREYRYFVDVVTPEGTSALKGTAWDALGQPIGDARVVLSTTALPEVGWFDTTGADGRFEVRKLPPGTYSVLVLSDTAGPWLTRISLPDTITLELTPVLGLGEGPEASLGR